MDSNWWALPLMIWIKQIFHFLISTIFEKNTLKPCNSVLQNSGNPLYLDNLESSISFSRVFNLQNNNGIPHNSEKILTDGGVHYYKVLLYMKIYWISPDTLKNSTKVTTLLLTHICNNSKFNIPLFPPHSLDIPVVECICTSFYEAYDGEFHPHFQSCFGFANYTLNW